MGTQPVKKKKSVLTGRGQFRSYVVLAENEAKVMANCRKTQACAYKRITSGSHSVLSIVFLKY